jgi:hypothetical protein
VTLRHLLRLVIPFMGRFLVLGLWLAAIMIPSSVALVRAAGVDIDQLGDPATHVPIFLQIEAAALFILMDFLLTFVTPALAFSTKSVALSWHIGFTMILGTWPRSALYVLCHPLALTLLTQAFPVGGRVVQLTLTSVFVLLGLVAKGAIAAFHLRERGAYSDDGAAWRIPQDDPLPGPALATWMSAGDEPTA